MGQPGTVPAGAPGSIAIVRQPLEWWERALGAVGGIGAIANRNFLGAVEQFETAIRGEREIGRIQVPTTFEQQQELVAAGNVEGQILMPIIRELQDAQGTDRAGDVGAKVVENVTDIVKRRGMTVAMEALRQTNLEILQQRQELEDKINEALYTGQASQQAQAQGEMRREAIAAQRPSRVREEMRLQFIEDEALRRPASSFRNQEFTAEERRRWLDEYARTSPFARIERQALEGMDFGAGASPQSPGVTQDQATEAARKFWEKEGRNPSDTELRQILELE
jgi:hypothetical protein